jgi:hypothetical protein
VYVTEITSCNGCCLFIDGKSSDDLALRVSALESELSEIERTRTQQLSESQQMIENLEKTVERLRNENRELQQKVFQMCNCCPVSFHIMVKLVGYVCVIITCC